MLKHKLRRTTEIISFSKRQSDKKKSKEKDALYSKVRKSQTRKVEEKEKISSIADGGYFTGPESFYETPDTSRTAEEETPGEDKPTSRAEPRRGDTQESQHYESLKGPAAAATASSAAAAATAAPAAAPVAYLLPVPVVWCRRSTPQEDFLWTAQGVENLVRQQQLLVKDFSAWLGKAATNHAAAPSTAGGTCTDGAQPAAQTDQQHSDASSGRSSIKKLQRILEIEEMRQFSERLDKIMTVR